MFYFTIKLTYFHESIKILYQFHIFKLYFGISLFIIARLLVYKNNSIAWWWSLSQQNLNKHFSFWHFYPFLFFQPKYSLLRQPHILTTMYVRIRWFNNDSTERIKKIHTFLVECALVEKIFICRFSNYIYSHSISI